MLLWTQQHRVWVFFLFFSPLVTLYSEASGGIIGLVLLYWPMHGLLVPDI